jgi:hypothetical protein
MNIRRTGVSGPGHRAGGRVRKQPGDPAHPKANGGRLGSEHEGLSGREAD